MFGCSIPSRLSQSLHLTNRHPESARFGSKCLKTAKRAVLLYFARVALHLSTFRTRLVLERGRPSRLYYCWRAAEPYSVYTRDPPPPSPSSRSTVARPEWSFSAVIGPRGGGWGAREVEGKASHTRSVHFNQTCFSIE